MAKTKIKKVTSKIKASEETITSTVKSITTKTFTLKGFYCGRNIGEKIVLGAKGEAFYKSLNLI